MTKGILGFLAAVSLLALSGCGSMVDSLMSDMTGTPSKAVSAVTDPLEGYVFCYTVNQGDYHVAKVLSPATEATKGEAEVLDLGGKDEKRFAKVFTSHEADKSELVVGAVVLVQGTGWEDPDKASLIDTTWGAYYLTDVSDLYKGKVTAGSVSQSIKHIRIPDTEIDAR